jgi:crotonobetainyl-CoA:carnitine CoA-transferase CaiB-like acyl-CoA transferase
MSVVQPPSTSPLPLKGLKVVELARILAGPWIGQTLADLGADVIKVESPEGDETRRWGPPFVRQSDGSQADAAYFHCCNRGKRSVIADLASPEGQRLVRELILSADVLVENFKVGGLKKYPWGRHGRPATAPHAATPVPRRPALRQRDDPPVPPARGEH